MSAKTGYVAKQKMLETTVSSSANTTKDDSLLFRTVGFLLLGFILAGASVLGQQAPFAVAFVGASGCGICGIAALAGSAVGYVLFHGLSSGISYIAAGVMIYTAAFVCQYIPAYKSRWFMPVIVTVVFGVTIAFGTVSEVRSELPFVLRMALEVCCSGIFTYLYARALGLKGASLEDWGASDYFAVAALGISVLSALSGVVVLRGISVGRVVTCLVVMTAAYCGGAAPGTCIGTGCGAAMDMITSTPSCFTMSYAFSALVAGTICSKGKIVFIAVYIACTGAALILLWSSGEQTEILYEALISAVVFLVLPGGLLRRLSGLLQHTPAGVGELRMRRHAAKRIWRIGAAFETLCTVMQEDAELLLPQSDMNEIFDHAAEAICSGCARKSVCWTNHYLDMLLILGETAPVMERRGKLQTSDLPSYFCDYCPNYDKLILAINYELRRNADRRLSKMNEHEYVMTAGEQYGDFARILHELSEGLNIHPGADLRCEQKLIRHLQSMGLNYEVGVFRDISGRLRITIAGDRLDKLTGRPGYLDELSQILGMRLCRPTSRTNNQSVLLLEAEPLAVTVGVAAKKKRGEAVSGDRGRYFKTDSGVLYVILSDGIGTGDRAAEQSSVVVDILERFLRSGISPVSAMKLINSAMLLKNREAWGYATVDLLSVDLFTGEAAFYKYGAAPSYVYSAEGLQRITGDTLSAGMISGDGQMPDMRNVQLKPGNVVVIASDGVMVDDERLLLRQILEEQGSMKHLARSILLAAQKSDPFGDDMTVLTISLEERK